MSYRRDREWSDRFIPAIKRLVGPHLLEPSNLELDTQQATDLVVLIARDLRVAARVRRPGFAERFPYQFTIRSQRDSGVLTELQKIVDGWGDWLFYGHAISDRAVGLWMIVNLHAFRSALIRRLIAADMTGTMDNRDGTSFAWFDVRGFGHCRSPILIASSLAVDEPVAPLPPPTIGATPQQLNLFAL